MEKETTLHNKLTAQHLWNGTWVGTWKVCSYLRSCPVIMMSRRRIVLHCFSEIICFIVSLFLCKTKNISEPSWRVLSLCARNATELLIKRLIASVLGGCYLDVARLSENIKEEGEGSLISWCRSHDCFKLRIRHQFHVNLNLYYLTCPDEWTVNGQLWGKKHFHLQETCFPVENQEVVTNIMKPSGVV